MTICMGLSSRFPKDGEDGMSLCVTWKCKQKRFQLLAGLRICRLVCQSILTSDRGIWEKSR
jgi:hypothetical protein